MKGQELGDLVEPLLKCWAVVPALSAAAAWQVGSVTQDNQLGGGLCAHSVQP